MVSGKECQKPDGILEINPEPEVWDDHHRPFPFVTVEGEVADGDSRVPLRKGMRVMEAVAGAGGFTPAALRTQVKLLQGGAEETWNMGDTGRCEPELKPAIA